MSAVSDSPPAASRTARPRRLWMWILCPGVGLLLGFLAAGLVSYLAPREFESVSVIQLNLEASALDAMRASGPGRSLATEAQQLDSPDNLVRVAAILDLSTRWSGSGDRSAARVLAERVSVDVSESHDLVRIRSRSDDAEEACEVARAVSDAYVLRRVEEEGERVALAVASLERDYREQELLVEELLGRAEALAPKESPEVLEAAMRRQDQLRKEILQLDRTLGTLAKKKGDERFEYAAGLNLPDNHVPFLMTELQLEAREAATLEASGLGESHPQVRGLRARLARLRGELTILVDEIEETLKAQRGLLERQREIADDIVAKRKEIGLPDEFRRAQRAHADARELLNSMKLEHGKLRMELEAPQEFVTHHERPEVSDRPVRSKLPRNLALGSGIGFAGGVLVPFPLLLLGRKK